MSEREVLALNFAKGRQTDQMDKEQRLIWKQIETDRDR